MDTIRILRVIEYSGPRDVVEKQVERSCHGEYRMPSGVTMRVATVGDYILPVVWAHLIDLPITEGFPGQREEAR